jgi:hypothetical protein
VPAHTTSRSTGLAAMAIISRPSTVLAVSRPCSGRHDRRLICPSEA